MDDPIAVSRDEDVREVDPQLLVEQYGWVHSVARNLVRDPSSAEDVTQETVLAALSTPPRDASDAPHLRAWLGRVAFNLSRLGLRQGARRRAREERVARSEALPSASDEVDERGWTSHLMGAVAELEEPYRSTVELRYFDELSTAEIARRTGTTELAVRKRLWRARGKLRLALGYEADKRRVLALLLPWRFVRLPRVEFGTALAAALCATAGGFGWWAGLDQDPAPARVAVLARSALTAHLPDGARGGTPQAAQAENEIPTPIHEPVRSGRVPVGGRALPAGNSEPADEKPALPLVLGSVLDLEGAPRPGLSIHDAERRHEVERPAAALALTDEQGAFELRPERLPLTLRASGAGWTTVCETRVEAGREAWTQPVLVAPALALEGRVVDGFGRALAGAELAILCDDRAFAGLERPIRAPSTVLRAALSAADGAFGWSDVPTGPGLTLRASLAGFETAERATSELESSLVLVLAPLPAEPVLAGIVRRRNGTAAAGASVRLALATARTDEGGRFELLLRGVQEDSVLEAWERGSEPARVKDFGRALEKGVRDGVDLVLGEELDEVAGTLEDGEGNALGGWRVFAFSEEPDEDSPLASAESTTDGDGAFRLDLPRGLYTLLVLDPQRGEGCGDGIGMRSSLDSKRSSWDLVAGTSEVVRRLEGSLRDDAGLALAGARVRVSGRIDVAGRACLLPLGELQTAMDGRWTLEVDARLAVVLDVEHPSSEVRTFRVDPGAAGTRHVELELPRAAYARVVGAVADSLSVLDASGRALCARGPTRSATGFALQAGRSSLLSLPEEARWLRLEANGSEPLLVPIRPEAGRILSLRP